MKRTYITPETTIVVLQQSTSLLAGSLRGKVDDETDAIGWDAEEEPEAE